MPLQIKSLLSACCLTFASIAGAQQNFSSGTTQSVMIELYTSQGCSSCPPAEVFLNTFTDNPRLWSSFVPIAFHVDYWDYLGWQDAYALPNNAKRQRRYADLKNVRTVYTPGFVVNGKGWRPGWFKQSLDASTKATGILSVQRDGTRFSATFKPTASETQATQLHIGILGMGLQTAIKAGENHGRHATHEFVLLSHQQFSGDGHQWSGQLPRWDRKQAARLALVAWVSTDKDPTPLQSTGGYLEE